MTIEQYKDELRAELRAMTSKQLRQFARDHHIDLCGSTTKHDMRHEIVSALAKRHLPALEGSVSSW